MTTSTLSTQDFIKKASSNETQKALQSKKITAVIPLFGFKKELRIAIPVLEGHSLVKEIILVDDGGGAEDFRELQTLASSGSKTIAVKHSKNLGFSAACNTGIELSDCTSDILLLNSDSVLARSSITLLALHSCIQPLAATIGTISNSNGFFSIELSREMISTLESADDLVNRLMLNISHVAHEEVISNNGYALYITRSAVEQVGLLDKAVFGRGYGEESDYCLRAKENGFINICSFLACGFHRGAGSFGPDKDKLKKINSEVIRAVHPDYIRNLQKYEDESELKPIQDRLAKIFQLKKEFCINIPPGLRYVYD